MDSGACEPVMTPEQAADYPITETEASKKGVAFISASGDAMPNMGERIIVVKKPCGRLATMRNSVTPCTGALSSVAKTIDNDNLVCFSKAASFILDLKTNDVDWLERVDDCFELEVEVVPYEEAKPMLVAAGFRGQLVKA